MKDYSFLTTNCALILALSYFAYICVVCHWLTRDALSLFRHLGGDLVDRVRERESFNFVAGHEVFFFLDLQKGVPLFQLKYVNSIYAVLFFGYPFSFYFVLLADTSIRSMRLYFHPFLFSYSGYWKIKEMLNLSKGRE